MPAHTTRFSAMSTPAATSSVHRFRRPAFGLTRGLAVALLAWAAAGAALATSSAVYSVSESLATSVGGLSTSVRKSSDSSVKTVVAQGAYEVIHLADAQDDGRLPVTVRALPGQAASGELTLLLPPQAVAQGGLEVGRVLHAQARPYGLELTRADTRQPFFLLLDDRTLRELDNVPVML